MKKNIFYCPLNLGANRCGIEYGYHSFIKKFPKYKEEIVFIDREIDFNENFADSKLKFKKSIIKTMNAVCRAIEKKNNENKINVLIGGDHSLAVASVSVASKYKDLGVIWVDAHGDMNTDTTTYSGNIHGMALASVIGLGDLELRNIYFNGRKIKPDNVVIFGTRDLDDKEENLMKSIGLKYFPMTEIRKNGFENSLKQASNYLKERVGAIHISFDLDSIDPDELSGVSTPSDNGFTKKEGLEIIDYIKKEHILTSLDIVEYNPLYEKNNDTASYINTILEII